MVTKLNKVNGVDKAMSLGRLKEKPGLKTKIRKER